jgi:ferredoxin--NADP+ reductase
MNTILVREQLSADVYRMQIHAPHIARERKAGQFIILQLDNEHGERIPLTIADANLQAGSITIIFQAVGKTTLLLSQYQVGDTIANILGPLGTPTHIQNYGHVVCVGGGIGVAPLYPIVQAMKQAGNRLTVIMGARNQDLLILREEMAALADNLIICTDDGSLGRKDLVTVPLKELCLSPQKPDLAVAIGPPIMMKFCAETTREFGVPTVVSLNSIMIDGTGMCGGCRVMVDKKMKFVCVDGPEFDGHLVDFQSLMLRLGSYKEIELEAHHTCKIGLDGK